MYIKPKHCPRIRRRPHWVRSAYTSFLLLLVSWVGFVDAAYPMGSTLGILSRMAKQAEKADAQKALIKRVDDGGNSTADDIAAGARVSIRETSKQVPTNSCDSTEILEPGKHEKVLVKATRLNVRACPSTDCKVIGVLQGGTHAVKIQEIRDCWALIRRGESVSGWTSLRYLHPAPLSPQKALVERVAHNNSRSFIDIPLPEGFRASTISSLDAKKMFEAGFAAADYQLTESQRSGFDDMHAVQFERERSAGGSDDNPDTVTLLIFKHESIPRAARFDGGNAPRAEDIGKLKSMFRKVFCAGYAASLYEEVPTAVADCRLSLEYYPTRDPRLLTFKYQADLSAEPIDEPYTERGILGFFVPAPGVAVVLQGSTESSDPEPAFADFLALARNILASNRSE